MRKNKVGKRETMEISKRRSPFMALEARLETYMEAHKIWPFRGLERKSIKFIRYSIISKTKT